MKYIMIGVIKLYRYCISPLFPSCCRFTPSCSAYSLEAIRKYGAVKGGIMALRRISKCHPFHVGGYDPVE